MNDIDGAFRRRFEGLKDHSVDPATQWMALEQSLTSVGAAAGSAGVATSSFWSVAASAAGLVAVSVVATMDSPKPILPERATGFTHVKDASRSIETKNSKALSWSEASAIADADWATLSSPADEAKLVADGAQTMDFAEFQAGPKSIYTPQVPQKIESSGVANNQGRALRDEVQRMDRLSLAMAEPDVAKRAELKRPDDLRDIASIYTGMYVRGGIRVGSGESNSSFKPAKWRINNVVSLGYDLPLSASTSISFEVGHLRRSGNGIERYKEIDFSPIIGVLASNFAQGTEQGVVGDLENIHESLVATTMDYIQAPVQIKLELNNTSKTAIGFFADYLVRIKNETYMVYNSRDYIRANFGANDERNIEGLKRLRFGLMASYQHKISNRLVGDVRGMLPITSQYDRKSEFNIHGEEPSQLVDFQLSLIYRI
ncbi:MAG: hypothetical protein RLP15_05705 [Cryomorphaceae bacterium]